MAWLLIKNQVSGDEYPGDIIEVRDESQPKTSRLERDPDRFIIISLPWLDASTIRHYMDAHVDDSDPENPITIHRRRYSVGDILSLLGPYHVEDNIYEIPQVNAGIFNGKLRDKKG